VLEVAASLGHVLLDGVVGRRRLSRPLRCLAPGLIGRGQQHLKVLGREFQGLVQIRLVFSRRQQRILDTVPMPGQVRLGILTIGEDHIVDRLVGQRPSLFLAQLLLVLAQELRARAIGTRKRGRQLDVGRTEPHGILKNRPHRLVILDGAPQAAPLVLTDQRQRADANRLGVRLVLGQILQQGVGLLFGRRELLGLQKQLAQPATECGLTIRRGHRDRLVVQLRGPRLLRRTDRRAVVRLGQPDFGLDVVGMQSQVRVQGCGRLPPVAFLGQRVRPLQEAAGRLAHLVPVPEIDARHEDRQKHQRADQERRVEPSQQPPLLRRPAGLGRSGFRMRLASHAFPWIHSVDSDG